ncbi:hypothetical protein [Salirhabdus sp. Marseille-P4669]|uniref:hypothetical protein n=1 Tax=Salirhabdus sp. Marseille-P4669 TaxID=2042310 RepID=UPI000C7C61FD|nr:hypothetical protein [Salirhabdus sp. Marseille-P4669]
MKKIGILLSLLTLCLVPFQLTVQAKVNCPSGEQLIETSANDKDELLEALKKLVPSTYSESDYGNYFSKWDVETALPLPKTVGKAKDEVYYKMAQNYCGEKVADKSWLVRLHFPLWEGKSDSAVEGQVYLAKSKEDGWFVWHRYK